MRRGFTLIEMVVAVGVFAVLSLSVTLALTSVLRGARKAAANNLVRSEGSYAIGVISGKLRYVTEVSACPNVNTGVDIEFVDSAGVVGSYDCGSLPVSNKVTVVNCSISCSPTLDQVDIEFSLAPAGVVQSQVIEYSTTTFDTQVVLRNK